MYITQRFYNCLSNIYLKAVVLALQYRVLG